MPNPQNPNQMPDMPQRAPEAPIPDAPRKEEIEPRASKDGHGSGCGCGA